MKTSFATRVQIVPWAVRHLRSAAAWPARATVPRIGKRCLPLLGERTDGLLSLGGKAESLNRLYARGCPVPRGFVLPSPVFGEAMADPDISAAVLRLSEAMDGHSEPSLAHAAKEVNALTRLESLLAGSIEEALARLPRRAGSFAVRSSATDEDGASHSFAGVLTSVLNVPAEEIPAAVLLCWAAAKSRRFTEYCEHAGMPPSLASMAVLVQPMVPARCAGVLLTHDPISGEPGSVIEAVAGHGNKLVAGEVAPQGYRLDSDGSWSRTANETADLLTSRDLRALRRLSERVLRLQGAPQDLEWAFEGGKLWLLQARPITTLPQRRSRWTRANLRELYPEIPSPMCASLLQRFRKYRLTEHLASKGLRLWHSGPWLRIINGRPYLNQSLLEALAGAAGFDASAVTRSIGGVKGAAQSGRWQWREAFKNAPALFRLFSGYLSAQQRAPLLLVRFSRLARSFDRRDLAGMTDRQLLSAILTLVRETCDIDDLAGDTMGGVEIFRLVAEKLLERRATSPSEFLAVTTVASANNITARQLRDTERLADVLRSDLTATLLLRQEDANLSDITRFDGTAFGKELRRFLQRYGTRAIHESDCAVPRLEEDPGPLLLSLLEGLDRPGPRRADETSRQEARAAWRGLQRSLPLVEKLFPIRIWLLNWLVSRLRCYYALRERIRFAETLLTSARRRIELTLGRRWEERGWLESASDYHWLRLDDVERALTNPGLAASGMLRRRVERWKERHAAWAATPMPNLLYEGELRNDSSESEIVETLAAGEEVRGLAISPGKVRGLVTLLSEVSNGHLPEADRILVAPVIGPSWAPLLARAKGVVVETGGMLSHGSILAREYGLPGIANIPNAMSLFREGEEVVLDGTTGAIRRIERGAG